MPDINLFAKVDLDVEISKAVGKLNELLALGSEARSGGDAGAQAEIVAQISQQIALWQQLADAKQRAIALGELPPPPRAPSASGSAQEDPEAAASRYSRNERGRIRRYEQGKVQSAVGPEMYEDIKDQIGSKGQRQQYYQQTLGFEEKTQRALPVSNEVRGEAETNNKQGRRQADIEAEGLRQGMQDPTFLASLAQLDLETKRFYTTMEQIRRDFSDANGSYIKAATEAAEAHQSFARELGEAKSANLEYVRATIGLAGTAKEMKAKIALGLQGVTPEEIQKMSPAELQAKAAEMTRRSTVTTSTDALKGASPDEIGERAANRAARSADRAAVQAHANETGELTASTAEEQVLNAQANAARYREILARDESVRALREERELKETLSKAVKGEKEARPESARVEPGGGSPGGVIQNLRAFSSGSQDPGSQQSLLQGLVGRGLRSTESMVGGFASGAMIFGLLEAVKEASKLQEVLAGLKDQLDTIGEGDQFSNMVEGITSISNATGVASDQVAAFTERMVGIYGEPTRALTDTKSAMELMKVAGVDLNTILQTAVPIERAYGLTMDQIGDSLIAVHDKYGIQEKDMLEFVNQTAATAQDAGFSFKSLEVIGAKSMNVLGQSAAMSGQQVSKVIQTMSGNADQIANVFQRSSKTRGLADPIIDAYASGDSEAAFKLILESYDQLDARQKEDLTNVSGSRREWALLNGLYSDHKNLLRDINDAESGRTDNSGALHERYQQVATTLAETFERLKTDITNIVQGLASTGVADFFAVMVGGFEAVLRAASMVLSLFNKLNDGLKLHPSDTGLLVYVTAIGSAFLFYRGVLSALTTAKEAHARVTGLMSAVEDKLTVSTAAATAAETEETVTVAADSTAKLENVVITTNMAGETLLQSAGAAAAGSGVGTEAGALVGGTAAAGGAGGATILGLGLGQAAGAVAVPAIATNWARDQVLEGNSVLQEGPGLKQLEATLKEQFHQANSASLQRLVDQQQTMWDAMLDNLQHAMFGVDMPKELAQKELASRVGQQGRQALDNLQKTGHLNEFVGNIKQGNLDILQKYFEDAGGEGLREAEKLGLNKLGAGTTTGIENDKIVVNKDTLTKNAPAILQAAKNNDAIANYVVGFLGDVYDRQSGLTDLKRKVDADVGTGDVQKAIDDAGGVENYLSLYDPKGALQTGQITPAQYQVQLAQVVADQREKLRNAKSQDMAAGYKKLDEMIKEGEDFSLQLLTSRIEQAKKLTEFSSETPKADEYALELEKFNALPSITARAAELPNLTEAGVGQFNEQLNSVKDPEARFQMAQAGMEVPAAVRITEVTRQLAESQEWSSTLSTVASLFDMPLEDLITWIAQEVVQSGKSAKDVLSDQLKTNIGAYESGRGRDTRERDALSALGGVPDIQAPAANVQPNMQNETITKLEGDLKGTLADIDIAKAQQGNQGRKKQAQLAVQAANDKYNTVLLEQRAGGPNAPGPDQVKAAAAGVDQANLNAANIEDDTKEALAGWAAINDFGDPVKLASDKLTAANLHVADVLKHVGGDKMDPDFIKAQQEARQAEIGTMQAQESHDLLVLDWAVILANGDPLQTALANQNHARAALANAIKNAHGDMNADPVIKSQQDLLKTQQEVDKAQEQQDNSWFAVLEAQQERDPLQVALLHQQQAAEALSRARGTTDEQNKLAAKIRADHALDDAINAGFEAKAGLAEALANAAGDTVEAAKVAADEAQRKLSLALSEGVKDEKVLDPLQAAVVTANANLQKTATTRREQVIDFQQQMGYITLQQAIASLKLLLDTTQQGTQDYEQLALKIHQLEQQAGQDLQFNLPSNLGLPTLYEARRVDQSVRAGIGYQDNRNIALVVQVNGAQDPAAVSNQVMSAFQSAMGTGSLYSPTVGVGA